jgi:hypothetical protein
VEGDVQMKSIRLSKGKVILAIALIVIIFGCNGCWLFFDGPEAEMLEYATEYQTANNKNPQTAAGLGNTIKEEITNSTGDKPADAAIGVIKILEKAKKAEALMEEARKNRDHVAMNTAIDMFPKDWTFRDSKYILSLEQNNVIDADRQKMLAEQFAKQIPGSYDKLLDLRINEFKQVIMHREEIERNNKKEIIPGMKGSNLYGGLSEAYKARFDKSKSPYDRDMMEYYKDQALKASQTPEF